MSCLINFRGRGKSRSVEYYHKKLEVTIIRANVEEDDETTIDRFFCGLNRKFKEQMDLRN